MKTLLRIAAIGCCIMAGALRAQTTSQVPAPNPIATMPSEAEVGELTAKAAEKVEAFQKTLAEVKPFVDKANPTLYRRDLEAIDTARTILASLKRKGRSAYGLVGLLATLDDLNRDAMNDATAMLLFGSQEQAAGRQFPDGMATAVLMLTSAADSFYDISELVMHATLRFVAGEEAVLAQVFADKK